MDSNLERILPRPTKINCLERIKFLDIPITSVVDVGVNSQTVELVVFFPHLKHYLFDASFYEDLIKQNYHNIDHEFISSPLSDKTEQKYLNIFAHFKEDQPSAGILSDEPLKAGCIMKVIPVQTKRFDEIGLNISPNFLLKIDTDGGEDKIIKGFGDIIRQASVVIIEVTFIEITNRIKELENNGFTLIDIVDSCYYGPLLHQCDAVFVRNDLLTKLKEENKLPRWDNFEQDKWILVNF